jgi:hypothetical protein
MNIMKCPILEIHSEKVKEHPSLTLIEVDLTYYYCGYVQRLTMLFFPEEWESAKKRGYFFS